MDIRKIGDLSPSTLSLQNKTVDKGAFRQMLQEKLSPVSQMPEPFLYDAKTDFIEQGEKVLDLLDAYAADLNNPDKTLKDIDPVVTAIEEEVAVLETKKTDHAALDGEMEGFVEELTITANVALLKFKRGDFI
jgi:hypothetical protein